MKVDPTAIDSPLALIALFVAIIELFLIFPIAKLDGRDRSMLVGFVIGYPIFIAGAFFVFLWNKPVNLYKPQTLSEHLQEALLPERLNGPLAPDRAAVVAVELKVTTLETQLRDLAQRVQGSPAGGSPSSDLAKVSDIEKLKIELLAKAEASGDVSRGGLATAARDLQTQEVKNQNVRVSSLTEQIDKFRSWIVAKGLKNAPPPPTIRPAFFTSSTDYGPSIGKAGIRLGYPATDYLIPGMYVNVVAADRAFHTDVDDPVWWLTWTTADYMASRFASSTFPNTQSFADILKGSEGLRKAYKPLYDLFSDLARDQGNDIVEAGVVRMLNDWNPKSNFETSLTSFAEGMIAAGAPRSIVAVVDKVRSASTSKVSAEK